MKPFDHVSPSQIDTYLTCKRKWWFQSVLGIKPPEHPSAALGTEVHAQLEKYLIDGTLPDDSKAGKIAFPGLVHLPKPGTVTVELNMEDHKDTLRLQLAGVDVTGRIDVFNAAGVDMPEVLDHKSTSDLKWAKSEDELKTNPQMIIYAKFARHFLQTKGMNINFVRTAHIVYLTKGKPHARPTSVVLSNEHVDEQWGHLTNVVEQMKLTSVLTAPAQAEPTEAACNKYGGCYFRDKCRVLKNMGKNNDLEDLFADIAPHNQNQSNEVQESKMNIVEQMRARRAAAAGATGDASNGTTTTTTTTAPDAAQAAAAAAAAQAQLAAAQAAAKQAAVAQLGVSAAAAQAATAKNGVDISGGASGILPPDAPSSGDDPVMDALNAATGAAGAAPAGDKTVRRPKQYKERLGTLGWTLELIERMSPETMRAILDGNVRPESGITIGENGEYVGKDGRVVKTPSSVGTTTKPAASTAAPDPLAEQVAFLLTMVQGDETPKETMPLRMAFMDTHPVTGPQWLAVLNSGAEKGLWMHDTANIAWIKPAPPPPPPVVESKRVASGETAQHQGASEEMDIRTPVKAKEGWTQPEDWYRPKPLFPASFEKAPGQGGLWLYVDCLPEKGFHADPKNHAVLEDLLMPFYEVASKQLNVPHYGVATFQEGTKHTAMLISGNLDKILSRWPTIVVTSRMGAAASVLEVLIPHAEMLIRGR